MSKEISWRDYVNAVAQEEGVECPREQLMYAALDLNNALEDVRRIRRSLKFADTTHSDLRKKAEVAWRHLALLTDAILHVSANEVFFCPESSGDRDFECNESEEHYYAARRICGTVAEVARQEYVLGKMGEGILFNNLAAIANHLKCIDPRPPEHCWELYME